MFAKIPHIQKEKNTVTKAFFFTFGGRIMNLIYEYN